MRAFLAALGTIITLSVLPIAAQAEDVDQLIRTMDELSHQTNDKNEAVKHKEDEVKAAEDEVNRLTGVAQDTEAVARTAEESEKAFQAEVNRIAGAKYRGVAIDPMSKIFGPIIRRLRSTRRPIWQPLRPKPKRPSQSLLTPPR